MQIIFIVHLLNARHYNRFFLKHLFQAVVTYAGDFSPEAKISERGGIVSRHRQPALGTCRDMLGSNPKSASCQLLYLR